MRRIFWIIGILALLVGGFFAYRAYSSARSAQAAQENLQTLALEEGTLAATIGATGTVRANQSANLGWQTSGTVDRVNVLLGDEVTKDQELADLSQTSLAQNVILAGLFFAIPLSLQMTLGLNALDTGIRIDRAQLRRPLRRTRWTVTLGAVTSPAIARPVSPGGCSTLRR